MDSEFRPGETRRVLAAFAACGAGFVSGILSYAAIRRLPHIDGLTLLALVMICVTCSLVFMTKEDEDETD